MAHNEPCNQSYYEIKIGLLETRKLRGLAYPLQCNACGVLNGYGCLLTYKNFIQQQKLPVFQPKFLQLLCDWEIEKNSKDY